MRQKKCDILKCRKKSVAFFLFASLEAVIDEKSSVDKCYLPTGKGR